MFRPRYRAPSCDASHDGCRDPAVAAPSLRPASPPSRQRSLQILRRHALPRALLVSLIVGLSGFPGGDAQARVFKCTDGQGRTHYSDAPCEGRPQTYKPRELNRIPAEQLTGGRKSSGAGKKDGWVSPLDPIANCEKQGGRFNREMRGCLLP